jgi:hypothetical protein
MEETLMVEITEKALELLPCPYCGEAPKLTAGIKVRCVNTSCEVMPFTRSNYCKGFEWAAVRDWNKRAII